MKTILLVEDNEMNRDMLSRRLQRRGYEVLTAVDGEEAIEMNNRQGPDIILLDIEIPKKDGLTVAQEIKAIYPNQPIIALTAHALAGDREKALAAGCDEYTTKPIDFQLLISLIDKLLR